MEAVFVVFFSLIVITNGAIDWNYPNEKTWPGKCQTGTMQSPINIVTKEALVDKHWAHIKGPLVFRGYDNVQLKGLNNGHTLKWRLVEESPPPMVSGGPLHGNYSFAQFHLHWLSEHAIDGLKWPLEIHMVHIKTGLSLAEALGRPDGIAVIGIMYNIVVEKAANNTFDSLMEHVAQLFDKGSESKDTVTLDLIGLFSPDMQSYYTYHGSLTTPDCQEVVTWLVMDNPSFITDVQYKLISKVDVGGTYNYRSLQPTNRMVYRPAVSCAALLTPSFPTLLLTIASCLASNAPGVFTKGFCLVYNLKKKFFGGTSKLCVV